MIVLEGIDASGKSTLGELIAAACGLTVQESEGPPKGPGEINERIVRYSGMKNTIFIRHPCVSQPIYGKIRREIDDLDTRLIGEFYRKRPFFIYCDPGDRDALLKHKIKPGEDPSHIAALNHRYGELLALYRAWAIRRAHIIYRIGDDRNEIIETCLRLTAASQRSV
jgi:hypothetical protein